MKMAKTLALMFALVLAVFCFNVPLVLAGDDVPWDEEGSGKMDEKGIIGDPINPDRSSPSNNSSDYNSDESSSTTSSFFIDVQLVTWYYGCLM
jgi:hypothetical protein